MFLKDQDMFLSEHEIIKLTGYHKIKYQLKELEKRGYPYDLDGYLRPIVLRKYVEEKLGVTSSESVRIPTKPNVEGFKKHLKLVNS